MELFQFFLIVFVAYLGIFVGTVMSRFAKEEISPGKKYFLIAKSISISLIFLYFFYLLNIELVIIIISSIIFFAIVHTLNRKFKSIYTNLIEFSLISIMFNESLKFNYILSVIVFFYLILFASTEYDIDLTFYNNVKNNYVKTFYFPIMIIVLYFI